jgi:hypothetical protein
MSKATKVRVDPDPEGRSFVSEATGKTYVGFHPVSVTDGPTGYMPRVVAHVRYCDDIDVFEIDKNRVNLAIREIKRLYQDISGFDANVRVYYSVLSASLRALKGLEKISDILDPIPVKGTIFNQPVALLKAMTDALLREDIESFTTLDRIFIRSGGPEVMRVGSGESLAIVYAILGEEYETLRETQQS